MNIAGNDAVVVLFSIFPYYWTISGSNANNVINDTNQLRSNEKWENHQKVYSMRSPRHIGESTGKVLDSLAENCLNVTKCDCNCDCSHAGTTISKFCIMSALQDIIKIKLMEMNLMMNIFRGKFQGTALMHSMMGAPAGTLPWDSSLDEYSDVDKTVDSLLKIFNKVFNMPNITAPSNLMKFMSELGNKTRHLLRSPRLSSYMVSLRAQNMGNLILSIQEKIENQMHEPLNYAVKSDNLALEFMNWTQKIFSRVDKSVSTNRNPNNFIDNVKQQYKSIVSKILDSRPNSNDFMGRLRNETVEMLRGFNVKFPGERIPHLFQNVFTIPPKPSVSSSTVERKMKFDWQNIINGLKTWLDFMKNIPLYIVQLFGSIKKLLKPSKIFEANWQKMKTSPLFLGHCYSSKIDRLLDISRHKQSHMPYLTSKSWKLKPVYVSFWDRLKILLNRGCNCP